MLPDTANPYPRMLRKQQNLYRIESFGTESHAREDRLTGMS
jgi:hypothetical protein